MRFVKGNLPFLKNETASVNCCCLSAASFGKGFFFFYYHKRLKVHILSINGIQYSLHQPCEKVVETWRN